MKSLTWYPGHMFKTTNQLKKIISIVDVFVIVVDARIPSSSLNNELIKLAKNKKVLLLFNKCDLSDDEKLAKWLSIYQNLGFEVLKISATTNKNINQIVPKIKKMNQDKINKNKTKGMQETITRCAITGIPNVGKSTLINVLTKSKITITADKPGVTKQLSWIKLLKDVYLLDSPGLLWPKLENETGLKLASIGAIKDEILPIDEVIMYLLNFLQQNYPQRLIDKFGVSLEHFEGAKYLEMLAQKYQFYSKNCQIDSQRLYTFILKTVRSKGLGGLCFDL